MSLSFETINLFNSLSSLATLIVHILFVIIIFAFIFRKQEWAKSIIEILSEKSLLIVFVISLSGMIGSLIYSEIIGYDPCLLCWIQRIFNYPVAIISFIALWKKEHLSSQDEAFDYIMPLTYIGTIFAVYQNYLQYGGKSLGTCGATTVSCAKVYFIEYGYITLPTMALTAFVAVIMVYIARNINNINNINK